MVAAYDFSGVDDMLPSLGVSTDRTAVIECSARRLITPYGSLWYDLDFGHDIRQYLNASVLSPGEVSHACATELEKDERVDTAVVVITQAGTTLVQRITLDDGDGPFDFTIAVSAVGVVVSA